MNASENHLIVEKTARYYMLGEPGPHVRHLMYVLHGYGQLAAYFIRKFESVCADDLLIVAPEGLSRFYLEGVYGRVGASWMTKEDRLGEIVDYVAYLDRLDGHLRGMLPGLKRTSVLGFSQGTATAWRWMERGQVEPDDFIIWAGSVPEEIFRYAAHKPSHFRLFSAVGDQDQYISQEAATAQVEKLNQAFPAHRHLGFEGGHTIPPAALAELMAWLRESHG